MRFYIFSLIVFILMGACKKAEYGEGAVYGQLSFYNASYTLDAYLPATAGSQKKVLVPLAPDGKQISALPGRGIPLFSQELGGGRQDFPDINWRNETPWMEFDRYVPGAYTAKVHLQSRDSASLFTFPVEVQQGQTLTYLLSDSMGTFHVTTFRHEQASVPGAIRIRLVQLCPDADSVNLRIGSKLVTGLQNMRYRSISAYTEIPLAADSTLKLRLFTAGDTLSLIGRKDLRAQPGQSYLLVFRQYSKSHQYADKQGRMVNIIPNGTLDVRKVE